MRDPAFDIVKFVLMLFVVIGHSISAGIVAGPQHMSHVWIWNMVVGVSMPLFFMMSGYFAASSFEKGSWGKISARAVGFLWPAVAFGVLYGFYRLATGELDVRAFLRHPYDYVMLKLWFVRTLVVVYLMSATIWKVVRNPSGRLVALAFAYALLIVRPWPFNRWWLIEPMHMFPYFLFGLFVLRRWALQRMILLVAACGLFFVAVTVLEGDCNGNGMSFYWVSAYWRDMLLTRMGLVTFVGRTCVGISGSVFLLGLVSAAVRWVPRLDVLSVLGTTTLGVYVMHEWLLIRAGAIHPPFPLASVWFWPVQIGIFLAFHFAIVGLRSFRLTRIAFFGDEKTLAGWCDRLLDRILRRAHD